MATCPKCKTTQSKRKNGRCPKCMTPVTIYKGVWFSASVDNPVTTVLSFFEQAVSTKLTVIRGDGVGVVYKINKKSYTYKRELLAANRILNIADYDLELIKDTFAIMFSRKLYKSLIYIDTDFLVNMAVAVANRDARNKVKAQGGKTMESVAARGELFDYDQ